MGGWFRGLFSFRWFWVWVFFGFGGLDLIFSVSLVSLGGFGF